MDDTGRVPESKVTLHNQVIKPKIHSEFLVVTLDLDHVQTAIHHALDRTKEIVRQFIPRKSALNHLETNYIGALGELAVLKVAGLPAVLERNYDNRQVDSGDVLIKGKIYDVKTEAIPQHWFQKLADGSIRDYEPYGCRVFTVNHAHHLKKYSGGIIFCSLPIREDEEAKKDKIRESLLLNREILVPGFTTVQKVRKKKPTWYTPKDSQGKKRKYNSKNFIFHHSELMPFNLINF